MRFKHYGEAPWVFKGRALYQLQLVPVKEAEKYVPPELKLVSLFGYTLGGFYLARYTDSPVGAFDELVAIAGIVWNWPTSSAWAARVYVNNSEARDHGLQRVGLPSRFVSFNANTRTAGQHEITPSWWDGDITASPATNTRSDAVAVRIEDNSKRWFWRRGAAAKHPVVAFTLPDVLKGWKGPRIPLALPSYSGNTDAYPGLLHYACQLHTNVQFVKPLRVRVDGMGEDEDESMRGVFGGRALLTMAFEDMEMRVEEPMVWLPPKRQQTRHQPALAH